MDQDEQIAEYQIPAEFLLSQDKTAVYTASTEPINEQKLYQELSDVSSEVIRCRNSILAKIY